MRIRAPLFPSCGIALLVLFLLIGCSRPTPPGAAAPNPAVPAGQPGAEFAKANASLRMLSKLPGHIWRVTGPAPSFLGSIYIFVDDGTLLETSCKETYRIATWSTDPDTPQIFQVFEDGRPAFTGTILESSATTLQVQRRLSRGDTNEIKLEAVAGEFVCPDMR